METIMVNRKELKKIIRETLEDVLNDRKDLISDAVAEAIEDIGLAKAMDNGRTEEFVDTEEFKRKLANKIKRAK
ncbi:MAG: hypothetical protein M1480_15685 [Bacteroidetes bacterium]|nr:hypothetical protein [Bacteroidota bacterium]